MSGQWNDIKKQLMPLKGKTCFVTTKKDFIYWGVATTVSDSYVELSNAKVFYKTAGIYEIEDYTHEKLLITYNQIVIIHETISKTHKISKCVIEYAVKILANQTGKTDNKDYIVYPFDLRFSDDRWCSMLWCDMLGIYSKWR